MAEALAVALLIAFPIVGFASGRWSALVLPLLGWPFYYLGLHRSWWGQGLGDGWEYAAGALTAAGVATTAFAVAVARRWTRQPGR